MQPPSPLNSSVSCNNAKIPFFFAGLIKYVLGCFWKLLRTAMQPVSTPRDLQNVFKIAAYARLFKAPRFKWLLLKNFICFIFPSALIKKLMDRFECSLFYLKNKLLYFILKIVYLFFLQEILITTMEYRSKIFILHFKWDAPKNNVSQVVTKGLVFHITPNWRIR